MAKVIGIDLGTTNSVNTLRVDVVGAAAPSRAAA